jgi:hypothetical protein
MAPNNMPATKNKFQDSLRQLYLKKGMFAGMQAAQICRNDEDTPNALLPIISSNGTVSPINGPATYQGQGCLIHSQNCMVNYFCKNGSLIKKAVRHKSHSYKLRKILLFSTNLMHYCITA